MALFIIQLVLITLVLTILHLSIKASGEHGEDAATSDETDNAGGDGFMRTFGRTLTRALAVSAPLVGSLSAIGRVSGNGTDTDLVSTQNVTPGPNRSIEWAAPSPLHETDNGMGQQKRQLRVVNGNQTAVGQQMRQRIEGNGSRLLHELANLSGDIAVHDPSMVQLSNGLFVLYSTHNGMEERQSKDLTFWYRPSQNSAAFPNGLDWANGLTKDLNEFWAPDVSGPHGKGTKKKYWLFYAVPVDGTKLNPPQPSTTRTAKIGRAVSRTAMPGTWRDKGPILSSNEAANFNAIDPNLFVDTHTQRWWLQFGSYLSGIHQVELSPRTGAVLHGAEQRTIAARPNVADHAIEAPFLFKKDKWYFLFVSFGHCCQGISSTYSINVGRAKSANGPFKDRSGTLMTDGGGTLLLGTNGDQIGPGGQSIVTSNDGRDILVYHYYDANANGKNTLGLRQIDWDKDKWPTV